MLKQQGGIGGTQERLPASRGWSRGFRRLGTAIAEFVRELDRGIDVMHGRQPARRPADQPSPAELDVLARAGVAYPRSASGGDANGSSVRSV